MKKIILILLAFLLLIFACSSNWDKSPAPAYRPYATAKGVR
jgi:hypothetical protein